MVQPHITFVQKNPFPNFGIVSIAGYLKQQNIDSDVIYIKCNARAHSFETMLHINI